MKDRRLELYFRDNVKIIVILLFFWAVFSFGTAAFSPFLNNYTFMNFPLGYYFGSQGALLVFLVLVFANAFLMDGLDRKYGYDKEAASEKKAEEEGS